MKAPLAYGEKRSILHFAPEFSLNRYINRFAPRHYVTADALVSFIPGICVRPAIVADLCNLNLPSDSFDVLICNHVLEHVQADERAIREMYRVLRPGGLAIVTVPIEEAIEETVEEEWINTKELRTIYYGSPDHVRQYGMDIVDRFGEAGFEVEVRRPEASVPADKLTECGLIPNEPHFILSKSSFGNLCTASL